ncbi:MAG TPA: hypothetical protein VJY62_14475 [Bacteroidia bacterium]|nr:hypothetical protein [Bacteroidia bacterium]
MKKRLLLFALFFISVKAYSIIYWQPYPITAAIGTNGMHQRLECSVYDSLLGSWQYYNTPYFNSWIDTSHSTSSIIVFSTYHPPPAWDMDTIYGYIIYDQEFHQFMPVLNSHYDPDYPGAWIRAHDGVVGVETQCCEIDGYPGTLNEAFIYDIKSHTWKGGTIVGATGMDGGVASMSLRTGGFISSYYNDYYWDPEYTGFFYDPVLDSFPYIDYWLATGGAGDQDIYYAFDDAAFNDDKGKFSAFDPTTHNWHQFDIEYVDNVSAIVNNGIFYSRDEFYLISYFGIYDDSLHQWQIDEIDHDISNPKIKDRVVAYTDTISTPQKVFYEVFSPTLRAWVKDSSTVASGIDSLYIQNGTVKWVSNAGVFHKAGYNDATGWGNFNTPLLLNFHLIDFYSSTGKPLIFVRNYSIGTDSVMYDFGDGITTGWHQNSLWHLYKVNGHYVPGGINYNVCIKANTPGGMQTSCTTVTQPCSATFNITSNCPGVCNGSIAAIPQTGQSPFIFQWSNGATSSNVNSLCAGNYTVTITDNTGCSVTSQLGVIPMTLAALSYPENCTGACDGMAYANVTGGAFPYIYLWSTGDTTSSISNLCAGSYTVTVTDGNNCTKSAVITLTNPSNPLSVSSYGYPPYCAGSDNGAIDFDIQGGTLPYTYVWSPAATGTVDTSIANTFYWSDLTAGIYTLTVTDGNGCSVSHTDSLVDPPPLFAIITAGGPLSFCVGGGVMLTANSGTGYSYHWVKNGFYITGAISSFYYTMAAGSYQVQIFDINGCDNLSSPVIVTTPCRPKSNVGLRSEISSSEENNPELFVFYHPSFQTTSIHALKLKGKYYTLRMYDILGKEVFKEEGTIAVAKEEGFYSKDLNVAAFTGGMYLISLQTEKEKLFKKFMKE